MRRLWTTPGFVDPERDRLLSIVLEGLLPNDNPDDGMKNYFLRYRISEDGGRTSVTDQMIVQPGYTPDHPFECIWVGKNSIMIGDMGSRPIRTRQGEILVPVQTSPIGPDGEYYNPGGGLSFHESAVLIGRWKDNQHIDWSLSDRISIDPGRSTRGAVEPTIAQLPDGRILMVIRGSNGGSKDPNHQIPSYRWVCVSEDGGRTWGIPKPWTDTDGNAFFSPSSCSQLLNHSNGKFYWLGNISPNNCQNNSPRYPFIIAEVDPDSLQLKKETIWVVDDRTSDEDPSLTLSNFMAHEDRQTGEIILHMSRFFPNQWFGDAFEYRIRV
ncbi:MAG: exo-alpha-sialidase [Phycisphaerales bacterium]|nr:exo-alpha-sialidase [Phycisphaerales bacterium]